MKLSFSLATTADAPALAALRSRVAEQLTQDFGKGHWSGDVTVRGVLAGLRHSRTLLAKSRGRLVATLRLATKKPWAIDRSFFTECRRPLYLVDMAVEPRDQRKGIGRLCMEEAIAMALAWDGDCLRLDAYDAAAGAGPFYAKCGFQSRGRVRYRGTPLVYFERLLPSATPPPGRKGLRGRKAS